MSDDRKRRDGSQTSGLLGDLESIRSLLDEQEDESATAASRAREREPEHAKDTAQSDSDDDVPLLEDVVHGGVSVSETFLSGEGDFIETTGTSRLNDETFKALLSDEWREAAGELLGEARAAIEQQQTVWTPRHTEELNEALKVRIDETVQEWLREVVRSRIRELGDLLLEAVSGELRAAVDRRFKESMTDEDPDAE